MLRLKDPSLLRNSNYIGGRWRESDVSLEVINPATGLPVARVADATVEQLRDAIAAAHDAFQLWRTTTAKQRARLLRNWFDLIVANSDDLALLMTSEQGKPLGEAKDEVQYAASFIEWFAEEAKRTYGRTIPTYASDRRLLTIKQPVGVVACITPWNFPAAMLTRKAAPAIAAGCTVVAKPATETPLTALALCELADRAGLPPGVFNVVVGSNSQALGLELTQHPQVAKLSFTGSTAVGKQLMAQCASTVKKVSLELGGNAPFIIFDDADIDAALKACVATKFRNAGQTCVCTNRIYVQASIADEFTARLKSRIEKFKIGNGTDEGVEIGPLITQQAVQKVQALVDDARQKGASLLLGGETDDAGVCFFQPTLLSGVCSNMRIVREEIFGPVAAVQTFNAEQDVIREANNTEYGLAAYVFSRDIHRVNRVVEALDYGIVASNTGVFSTEVAPFGGVKQSGIGREGGAEGIEEYLQVKYHCMGVELDSAL